MRTSLLALALVSSLAHAGGKHATPLAVPDTWDGWENHGIWSAGIATTINLVIPTAPEWVKFGLCLIPGHIHERNQRNRPGLRYSEKDMVSNAVGCAVGQYITNEIRMQYYPGYIGIAKVWEF